MKKEDFVAILAVCALIAAVLLLAVFGTSPPASSADETGSLPMQSGATAMPKDESTIERPFTSEPVSTAAQTSVSEPVSTAAQTSVSEPVSTEAQTSVSEPVSTEAQTSESAHADRSIGDALLGKALFIGDSRTVGLMEYGGIENADFFCSVGMSVFNIHKKPISVPNVGKVTLTELLSDKKYGRIYIMLGVNELGYPFDSIVAKYGELIDQVREKQADAAIFIQANLHVTESRSGRDKVVNNPAINRLNGKLAKLADEKQVFYLDANPVFDDAAGGLTAEKSEDGAHLYGKYYTEWSGWILNQTASRIGEGRV